MDTYKRAVEDPSGRNIPSRFRKVHCCWILDDGTANAIDIRARLEDTDTLAPILRDGYNRRVSSNTDLNIKVQNEENM